MGHAKLTCWEKISNLEEKVKQNEGDVVVVWLSSQSVDTFSFNIENSQLLHAHTSKNEWVVDSSFPHHMVKHASLFYSLDVASKKKIYVVDDFSLDIVGRGDIPCQWGWIVVVYHVPNLNVNFLSVSQLT